RLRKTVEDNLDLAGFRIVRCCPVVDTVTRSSGIGLCIEKMGANFPTNTFERYTVAFDIHT
ncbi:unnamed protein product, partial [Amoebophrya sp. A25]